MNRHVCPGCGKPRPLGRDETFFTALGVPEKFSQDPSELQKRFYRVSRALHPDRFVAADEGSRKLSLERMSFLNEAYATLRDPAALRGYVLALHGLKTESVARAGAVQAHPAGVSHALPMELAELWFELQEDWSAENAARFMSLLAAEEEGLASRISALEKRLDGMDPVSAGYRESLEELAQAIQQGNYLRSMRRDAERLAVK